VEVVAQDWAAAGDTPDTMVLVFQSDRAIGIKRGIIIVQIVKS
jgi:hypothetical protein